MKKAGKALLAGKQIYEIPPEDFFVHTMPNKVPDGQISRIFWVIGDGHGGPSHDTWGPGRRRAAHFYWLPSKDPTAWMVLEEEW